MLIGHILHFSFNDILEMTLEEFDYFSEQAEIILKALYGVK